MKVMALLCGAMLWLAVPVFAQTKPRLIADSQWNFLVGSASGDQWLASAHAAPLARGGESYMVFDGPRVVGTFRGSKAISIGPPCEDTFRVKLQLPPFKPKGLLARRAGPPAYVGVSGATAKQLMPRKVEVMSATSGFKEIVAAWLRAKGVKNPQPGIVKVWRADIDGDNRQEIIINAIRHNERSGVPDVMSADSRAGDHSLLLVRRIVDGKVQTVVVSSQIYTKHQSLNAPSTLELAGVMDLNGDGKMEIVTRGRYHQGSWVSVYEWRKGVPKAVISTGCGV
jgi:hypothetical protein